MNNTLPRKERSCIIGAALLSLFLGALDALVMTAAMPTIVAELGGLHLYSWVYSAYFLARAVSLPIIGKLSDVYSSKNIFLFSIMLFLLASAAAGAAPSMSFLVAARVVQGVGAGGIFALVYIVLSDISPADERAKTLSFASSIWGIASVVGPTLGGFIVTYFSWRWIFFINVPVALVCLAGIGLFLKTKQQPQKKVDLDFAGVGCLSGFILSFLSIFIVGGRDYGWYSFEIFTLCGLSALFALAFYYVEKRAKDPVIDLTFFKNRNFAAGNIATFFSSFAIFSLFAYAPLFIQGALGKTPMQVAVAMLSLSLGWSFGSLFLGRFARGAGGKTATVSGALLLIFSSIIMLFFSAQTSILTCFFVFQLVGIGMGFVTLSSLLLVQASLPKTNLGVATSLHQFSRTLGGTVGVGICGGIVTTQLINNLEASTDVVPPAVIYSLLESMENLFRPEFQALLADETRSILYEAVARAMSSVHWIVLIASLLCLGAAVLLRREKGCV